LFVEVVDCQVETPPYTQLIDSMPEVTQLDLSRVSYYLVLR